MRANVKNIKTNSSINPNHRKDKLYESYLLVKYDRKKAKIMIIAELRIYIPYYTCYACLWIKDYKNSIYTAASGKAGGYGYHKQSAASQECYTKLNIEFGSPNCISGVGDSAIEESLIAVGNALGYKNCQILKTNI